MKASETKFQNIIEGTVQYIVPMFQRTYSWEKREWQTLWEDIEELCELENPKSHFIGSMVSMPTVSVPEGVSKYLLIDGQQRLTTIFILLALLRDLARQNNKLDLADEIQELFLINKFKKGQNDYFKLMPTQADRDSFKQLIENKEFSSETQIANAYDFFKRKIKQSDIQIDAIQRVVTSCFSIVSIVLDANDNPYLVFESLNAKGRPLTQADLIRNYFFMRIHIDKQDDVYNEYWFPMQKKLDSHLTEFIRHFLMRDGGVIRQTEVYYTLKEEVDVHNAVEYLKRLNIFSQYYYCLVEPDNEPNEQIRKYLKRLNRIEVTTAYPLLLNTYHYYANDKITTDEFINVLKVIENYLIRRYVCGYASNQLAKNFPAVSANLLEKEHQDYIEHLKIALQSRNYPKDYEFREKFKSNKMYGGGDKAAKTKLILETIEHSYNHKEMVNIDSKYSIEHIMPQELTDWWKEHLGRDWTISHEIHLHNVGNLTLTAYNSELSNDTFSNKREKLMNSHLEINKYFVNIHNWGKDEIERRAEDLAEIALKEWAYFGKNQIEDIDITNVTGTSPHRLEILKQNIYVSTWRDVLEQILNTIIELEPEKFDILANKYSSYIGKDKKVFRATRELKNRYYVEVNLSAKDIQKICSKAMSEIGFTEDDWSVYYN